MIDFIQSNYAAHPILTMAALVWMSGNVIIALVVSIALVGAWLDSPFVNHTNHKTGGTK